METAETSLFKIADYIAQLEIILSSVDLRTRKYIDDYDYDGLPETHDELMDWMDENRTMVYNCLTIVEDALDGIPFDDEDEA